VSTVIWATGHRRSYPWLHVPTVVADREIVHRYGVTPVPGLYVLGQRFQRTRRSTSSTARAPTPSPSPGTS
jgi:putative flavoprotein involved in K+ transport